MSYSRELTCALKAAQEAGILQKVSAARRRAVTIKKDGSPVTGVDRACEALVRDQLLSVFPDDGFLGEETGNTAGRSGRRWIVDPLDGTRPYCHDIPTYSVLIALEDEGDVRLGVIHLPSMNTTCWATKGGGAFLNGKPIRVSAVRDPRKAFGTALGFVEKARTEEGRRLLSLMGQWDYSYGFMDAYSYVCVASGRLDIAVNLLDKAWDCAAAACIVREAGGRFSDIRGAAAVDRGSIILSNGVLHDAALRFFAARGSSRPRRLKSGQ